MATLILGLAASYLLPKTGCAARLQQQQTDIRQETDCECGKTGHSVLQKQGLHKQGFQKQGLQRPTSNANCDDYEVNTIQNVEATSESTVAVSYELNKDYPTVENFSPYYAVFRACDDPDEGLGEEIERQPLQPDELTCGPHTINVDLRHIAGDYQIYFQVDDPTIGFQGFGNTFSILNGSIIDFTPGNPINLEGEPAGSCCPVAPAGCITGLDQPQQGGSAVPTSGMPMIGEQFEPGNLDCCGLGSAPFLHSGCTDCGSTGNGPPAELNVMPFVPMSFALRNHMSARQSSFGLGGFSPFDSSVHAGQSDTYGIQIQLTDAAAKRSACFEKEDDGKYFDTHGLYREAELIGGSGLASATHILVTRHNGETMKFELFELAGDVDKDLDRDGRLVEWKNRAGHGYDMAYQDDNSFRLSIITDPHGREYGFNFGTAQAGRDAVSSITMQDGARIEFGYSTHVLSDIQVKEPGTGTTIWHWTNAVSGVGAGAGNLTRMEIDSPSSGKKIYRFHANYISPREKYLTNPLSMLASVHASNDTDSIVTVHPSEDDNDLVRLIGENGLSLSEFQNGVYLRQATSFTYDPSETDPWQAWDPEYPVRDDRNVWLPAQPDDPSTTATDPPTNAPLDEWLSGSPPVRLTRQGQYIHIKYDEGLADGPRFVTERRFMKQDGQELVEQSFEETERNENGQRGCQPQRWRGPHVAKC